MTNTNQDVQDQSVATGTKAKTAAEKKAEAAKAKSEAAAEQAAVAAKAAQTAAEDAALAAANEAAQGTGVVGGLVANAEAAADQIAETAIKLNDALTPEADKTQVDADVAAQTAIDPIVEQIKTAVAKIKSEAEVVEQIKKSEADESVLTPLQLRVKNNGQRAICHVTQALIKANQITVITYESMSAKNLAKGNFAQINALKGSKRFEVEG